MESGVAVVLRIGDVSSVLLFHVVCALSYNGLWCHVEPSLNKKRSVEKVVHVHHVFQYNLCVSADRVTRSTIHICVVGVYVYKVL